MSNRSLESSIWPGFVDMLSAILMVILLAFTMFALSNLYLQHAVQETSETLKHSQTLLKVQKARWKQELIHAKHESEALSKRLKEAQSMDRKESERALALAKLLMEKLDVQEQDISKMRENHVQSQAQLEERNKRISDLEQRVEVLTVEKIHALWKSRSEFLGKLRARLENRKDVRVVGDRFVFQSEVLFEMGSSEVGAKGKEALKGFVAALKQISTSIPKDVNWVLRVDGHTDRRSFKPGTRFKNNLELSIARALAVVEFLKEQGVPEERLVAAGFGEFHPLKAGEISDRDRRIELMLDHKRA
jgi:chemotaxis protein MotB